MSTPTMNAVIWTGTEQVELKQVPVPETSPDELLIKVAYNGICGTDLSIYKGTHPRAQFGLIPGHEIVGTSASADDPRYGQTVVVEPLIECGQCSPCQSGYGYVCDQLGLYGIDQPGAMAEYVAIPKDRVLYVPETVSLRDAALIEPLAVAVHAVRLSGMKGGENVAIFGAGPIGILTALTAQAKGARNITIVEVNPWRSAEAQKMGFTVVADTEAMIASIRAANAGELADIVFDAAGHPAVSPRLTDVVKVRGSIVIVGVYKAPAPVNLQAVCFKELELFGVRVYSRADFEEAIELLSSGKINLSQFTVAEFGLDQAKDAFDAAAAGDGHFKVLLTPNR